MLAMYVVLESYLGMVCDYPDAYIRQPGFEFLRTVPTVWDETRVIGGAPGEWVSIARRKGSDWFVGTITGSRSRTELLALDFLAEGRYSADLYGDAPDAPNDPNKLTREQRTLTRTDVVTARLAGGGGHVIHLRSERR
jgi:alpha-glucosidase